MTGDEFPPLPACLNRNVASVEQWAQRITSALQVTITGTIEIGKLLIAAKAELPHGEWEAMVGNKLPFSPRTARMLMTIARDERIRNHGSVLPPSWRTIHEITKLSDEQFEAKIADGTINPDMERRDIALSIKQERRTERELELADKIMALPGELCGVTLEDLEWDFEVWSRETGMDRHAANHYLTANDAHTAQEFTNGPRNNSNAPHLIASRIRGYPLHSLRSASISFACAASASARSMSGASSMPGIRQAPAIGIGTSTKIF